MCKQNLGIRAEIVASGLCNYQVAREIGYSESSFYRILRSPLDENTEQIIHNAINKLKEGGRTDGNS